MAWPPFLSVNYMFVLFTIEFHAHHFNSYFLLFWCISSSIDSLVLSQRPDSEPVPTIDIIRHYLPDVVVFILTMVTIVATFVASSKIKICTREGNRAEHNGEDVTAARNEARPEVAHGASHDAHSHRPEAASHDTQRLEAPDTDNSNDLDLRMTNITTRHDGDHWKMPPFVVRCLDLAIFVMLGACGVTVPSLTSSLYLAIFLVKATLWAVHLEWWNRRLSVRLLLLVYTGCHLLVVYLYQFEVAKKLIPLQPANTTTSMVARWVIGGGGERERVHCESGEQGGVWVIRDWGKERVHRERVAGGEGSGE